MNNNLKYINSNNFSEISDFIFSEIVSRKQFKSLPNHQELIVLADSNSNDGEYVWYLNPNLDLKENDLIFCHAEVVEFLFDYLNKIENLKNIKLITHQSDRNINNRLFSKKPKCIAEWYGTNVTINAENLYAVPLGIGNEYLNIYKNQKILIDNLIGSNNKKNNSAFMNFRINTNTTERLKAFFALYKKEWVDSRFVKQDPEEYLLDLYKSKYTICPWGNGFDTHRLWESLYLGSIPVTKFHKAYEQFQDLPIIFIENWKKVNLKFLNITENKLPNQTLNKLTIDYWELKIKNVNLSTNNYYQYSLNGIEKEKIVLDINKKLLINKKIKTIKTFLIKFHYLKLKHYFTVKNI